VWLFVVRCGGDGAELGIDDVRGRVISVRWLQQSSWSPAHYTWLSVVVLSVGLLVVTAAFKYRNTVRPTHSTRPQNVTINLFAW